MIYFYACLKLPLSGLLTLMHHCTGFTFLLTMIRLESSSHFLNQSKCIRDYVINIGIFPWFRRFACYTLNSQFASSRSLVLILVVVIDKKNSIFFLYFKQTEPLIKNCFDDCENKEQTIHFRIIFLNTDKGLPLESNIHTYILTTLSRVYSSYNDPALDLR